MAYTRLSNTDVNRVCQKFEEYLKSLIDKKVKKRKYKLMNRFVDIFDLSEKEADLKIKKEMDSIRKNIIFKIEDDYSIYMDLRNSCKSCYTNDYITITSREAEFINKFRK